MSGKSVAGGVRGDHDDVISQMNLRGVRSADGALELLGLLGAEPASRAQLRDRGFCRVPLDVMRRTNQVCSGALKLMIPVTVGGGVLAFVVCFEGVFDAPGEPVDERGGLLDRGQLRGLCPGGEVGDREPGGVDAEAAAHGVGERFDDELFLGVGQSRVIFLALEGAIPRCCGWG